jgi:hypothetical protein
MSQQTSMETIERLCLQEITFWMSKTAGATTSARRRNRSQ